jgi:hypothetical protein
MRTHIRVLAVPGAFALAGALAACGSSTPSSSSTPKATPTPSATSSSPATTGSAAAATITANWTKFFDFSTPTAQREPLLENGPEFAAVLASQASNKLYSSANAKVLSVTDITSTQATVKYNILLGTTPALTNQTGTAVYQDGTWKVGDSSLCKLLTMEGLKSMPAACAPAG